MISPTWHGIVDALDYFANAGELALSNLWNCPVCGARVSDACATGEPHEARRAHARASIAHHAATRSQLEAGSGARASEILAILDASPLHRRMMEALAELQHRQAHELASEALRAARKGDPA